MFSFLSSSSEKRKGIWKYADLYLKKIEKKNQLILSDGDTAVVENKNINNKFNIQHLFFKREDENESESLKGRSLAYQVSLAKQNGDKNLIISTSGNAGIALAAYAKKAGILPFIFISPKTDSEKIIKMQKYNPILIESSRPIRMANYASAKYGIKNLRPSFDDDSIEGFKSISFELCEQISSIDAIFVFVTSGSSFVGIYEGFKFLLENGKIDKIPKMYAVQSGEINSVSGPDMVKDSSQISSAGKLGIKKTRRRKDVLEIISKTSGEGVYVNEEEVVFANEELLSNAIKTSWEGVANFAGFIKIQKKEKFKKAVCVFSGKFRNSINHPVSGNLKVENFEQVDQIINKFKK